MSGHTPGPWEVVQGHYHCFKEVRGPSFKVSAVMWATDLTEQDYEKRNADLVLVAAAPDLLKALTELVANQDASWLELGFTTEQIKAMPYLKPARAAIEKATGEKA